MAILKEYLDLKNGKKRPDKQGVYPVYGGNGVLAFTNDYNAEDCIAIGRVGVYCGNVCLLENKSWISDNAIIAKPKENADLHYMYYLLKSLSLNKRSIGSGQPLLTQDILNQISIDIPTLKCQKKISRILSLLDEKIQNNECINQNLVA